MFFTVLHSQFLGFDSQHIKNLFFFFFKTVRICSIFTELKVQGRLFLNRGCIQTGLCSESSYDTGMTKRLEKVEHVFIKNANLYVETKHVAYYVFTVITCALCGF